MLIVIFLANMLRANMNMSVDPCEDFYEYSCGKFIANSVIPEDQSSIVSFYIIEKQVQQNLAGNNLN